MTSHFRYMRKLNVKPENPPSYVGGYNKSCGHHPRLWIDLSSRCLEFVTLPLFLDVVHLRSCTDSKNEPPVVGPFSLLLVPSGYRYTCASWWVSQVPGPPYPLVPFPSFFVSLGVWLARVVSHVYADTSQCSE